MVKSVSVRWWLRSKINKDGSRKGKLFQRRSEFDERRAPINHSQ